MAVLSGQEERSKASAVGERGLRAVLEQDGHALTVPELAGRAEWGGGELAVKVGRRARVDQELCGIGMAVPAGEVERRAVRGVAGRQAGELLRGGQ